MRYVRWTLALAAVAALACSKPDGGDSGGGGGGGGGTHQLVRVDVTPANPSTVPGGRVAFHATGTYDDGASSDLTGSAVWTSTDLDVASVGSDGVAVARRAGTATIGATVSGVTGSAALTVRTLELARLRVEPPVATVSPGGTFPLRAIGVDVSGLEVDLNGAAAWATADSAVAEVSATGEATGVATGSARVTAAFGGKTASALVAVQPTRLVAIELGTPAFMHLGLGAQGTVSVTGVWSDGTRTDLSGLATLTSDDPAVVETGWTAYGSRTIRCVGLGTAHVTATYGALVSSTEILVTARALAWLELEVQSSPLPVGLAVPLRAIAVYDDFTAADVTGAATFTADGTAVTVGPGAVATGVEAGTAVLTARFGGYEAHEGVTVVGSAPIGLDVVPDETTLVAGGYCWVDTFLRYADGSRTEVSDWATATTSDPAVVSVRPTAWYDSDLLAVAPGAATITGSYAGLTGSAVVTVVAPYSLSLSVPPTVTVGTTFRAEGTATSPSSTVRSADLMFAGEWSSSNPDVLAHVPTTRSLGWFEARAPGTATITVRLGALTATQTVEVVGDATWLELRPATVEVREGWTTQLRAWVHLGDGTELDVTADAVWSATGAASTAYWSPGQVSGDSAGTGLVTARLGDLAGGAVVTVTPEFPDSLTIEPRSLSTAGTHRLPVSVTQNFWLKGSYYDGRTWVPKAPVTWATSNGAVATVSTDAADAAQVTTVGKGTATLTATYAGRNVSVTIVVDDLQGVTFVPSATVPIGGSVMPNVTATWASGTTSNVTNLATLVSADPAVVAVPLPGVVVGLTEGATEVTATFGTFSQAIPVAVRLPRFRSLLVGAATTGVSQLPVGLPVAAVAGAQLETMGTYEVLDVTDLATFAVSGPATLSGTPPVLQGTAGGTATLTATWSGFTATDTVAFVEGVPSLEVPSMAELPVGGVASLFVLTPGPSGYDEDVGSLATITSSDPAIATVEHGAYGRYAEAKAPGTALVTATYGGQTAETVVYVREGTPWVAIQSYSYLDEQPLHVYERQALEADETMGPDTPITGAATWSSSNPAVVKVVAPGVLEGVSPGVATITAAYAGGTARRTVAVSDAELEAIDVGKLALALPVGTEWELSVTGTYADRPYPAPRLWGAKFATEDAAVAALDASRPGVVQAKAAGVTYVTATVGTKTVRIPVTVF